MPTRLPQAAAPTAAPEVIFVEEPGEDEYEEEPAYDGNEESFEFEDEGGEEEYEESDEESGEEEYEESDEEEESEMEGIGAISELPYMAGQTLAFEHGRKYRGQWIVTGRVAALTSTEALAASLVDLGFQGVKVFRKVVELPPDWPRDRRSLMTATVDNWSFFFEAFGFAKKGAPKMPRPRELLNVWDAAEDAADHDAAATVPPPDPDDGDHSVRNVAILSAVALASIGLVMFLEAPPAWASDYVR